MVGTEILYDCIRVQDKLMPVVEWLDKTEKKVKDMELVPTDEEKIQQRIKEHDVSNSEALLQQHDTCCVWSLISSEKVCKDVETLKITFYYCLFIMLKLIGNYWSLLMGNVIRLVLPPEFI